MTLKTPRRRTLITGMLLLVLLIGCYPAVSFAQESRARPAEGCNANESEHNTAVGPVCITNGTASETSAQAVEGAGQAIANGFLAAALIPVVAISFLILTIASGLLWLAGVIFNWSVVILVFNFATYLGNSAGMLLAWGILRDFGNIVLLFGFVYMGIQTILQVGHFSVGRTLSRLIIFAVLLNFSLFIAEAVIDASNVFASTLYSQTYATSAAGERCQGALQECQINEGIASPILEMAGIGSVLSDYNNEQGGVLGRLGDTISNPIGEILKFFMLAMFVTVAAVVLFAAAFLIISRAIALAFLMVTSPIGFAGMAVPWLEKMANDWWDALVKQALFAPVFLILLFVGLKLVSTLHDALGGGNIITALGSSSSLETGPIIVMILVIGFMIGALLISKQFGIYGAETITKNALGAIKGVAASPFTPYRDFVGKRAENFRKSYNAFAGGNMAQLDKLAKKAGFAGTLAKPLISAAGGVIDDGVMSSLKGVQSIKVGSRTYAEQKKHQEEREGAMRDAARQAEQKKELGDAIKSGNTENVERLLQQMSTNDIKATSYIKEGKDGIAQMASALSTDKFAEIINDKEVNENSKRLLMDARFRSLIEAVRGTNANGQAIPPGDRQKEIRRWSGKDFDQLAKGNPQEFARLLSTYNANGTDMLSDSQIEHLEKSTALTNSQRAFVKKNTVGGRMDSVLKQGAPSAADMTLINQMKAKQKAKLSDRALMRAARHNLLRTNDFAELQSRNELSDTAKRYIARHIEQTRNTGGPNAAAYDKYMQNTVAQGYWTQ